MGCLSEIHEECGVFGVYSREVTSVASTVYYGLFALQHRGQESCGIAVSNDGFFNSYKDTGLVNEVFTAENIEALGAGNIAIGHVRYSTTGGNDRINAQPVVVDHIKGRLAIAHNGNLVNTAPLRRELELNGAIFHMTSDTEVISYLIIKERINSDTIEEAINRVMKKIKGAYSLVIMTQNKLIAVRDMNGFRPLCYGKTDDGRYIVASESCAIDAVGGHFIRDIMPGEILVIGSEGERSITENCNKAKPSMCVFEYVYFARPDSVIDGFSVHQARVQAGRILAKEHPVDADVVIGVPDSGLDAALGYSEESGIQYGIGLIKNKYIARTFIAPGQSVREDKVKIKLNPISSVVRDKRIVLVDDSIVRGTTRRRIVELLREAGAREIHMRISAPPFINPCYYGTDIDSKENLIACKYSIEEIAKMIGADSLGYLSVEGVKCLTGSEKRHRYCAACFGDVYPTELPESSALKNQFEHKKK